MKRLYRSEKNKIVAGIIGGIGEYFSVDPVLLRVVTIILLVLTGIFPVIVIYILCLFIIPKQSEQPTIIDVE